MTVQELNDQIHAFDAESNKIAVDRQRQRTDLVRTYHAAKEGAESPKESHADPVEAK